ncbi:hypothetical protein CDD81_579 [Ophiocordyceps australis]|uniref:non-specific serine/threonine protein kinase n=1 Tax=Ophiocordyceps australis TaxID=1399860 RepID=A0A2C5YGE7_9HYPO|nr:hypothetical protein CDD81_579 [Ophiocordyceps australis]
MSTLAPPPRQLEYQDVLGIARGTWATIARIRGTNLVMKSHSATNHDFHEIERAVYERLGAHPYILPYHGEAVYHFEDTAQKVLVLQYCARGMLGQEYVEGRVPPAAQRTRWLSQIVDALCHLHAHHITHADLGIHNILIQDDSSIALADFGGSGIDSSPSLVAPCTRYARPLISPVDIITPLDDIFALGGVLYELCTGRLLFWDLQADEDQVAARYAQGRYPDLELVPPGIRAVILACWRLEVQSVDEVAAQLGVALRAGEGAVECGGGVWAAALVVGAAVALMLGNNVRRLCLEAF